MVFREVCKNLRSRTEFKEDVTFFGLKIQKKSPRHRFQLCSRCQEMAILSFNGYKRLFVAPIKANIVAAKGTITCITSFPKPQCASFDIFFYTLKHCQRHSTPHPGYCVGECVLIQLKGFLKFILNSLGPLYLSVNIPHCQVLPYIGINKVSKRCACELYASKYSRSN